MDDVVRWRAIEEYLGRNAAKSVMEVIRVDIPGNYPHELLFILLFLLVILYYFTQWDLSIYLLHLFPIISFKNITLMFRKDGTWTLDYYQ